MHEFIHGGSLIRVVACFCRILAALAQRRAGQARRGHGDDPGGDLRKVADNLEKEFVDAAEAMPEDKFDFAPPGSRAISKACAPLANR